MRRRKHKGFTFAEILIALLVVGIVTVAAVPTMTKHAIKGEKMWNEADYPIAATQLNANYFTVVPSDSAANQTGLNTDNTLIGLIKTATEGKYPNAYLSLYNFDGNNVTNGGRLVLDRNNLGLGIGALEDTAARTTGADSPSGVYNTALGHYALFANDSGSDNTAIGMFAGESATNGNRNTAVGYKSLFMNGVTVGNGSDVSSSDNTAIGVEALNTKPFDAYSGNNTAIGYRALASETSNGTTSRKMRQTVSGVGGNNIAIGSYAGYGAASDTQNVSNKLYIGNQNTADGAFDATKRPFIEANLFGTDFDLDVDELIVNTADGKHTILKIRTIDDDGVEAPVINDNEAVELDESGNPKNNKITSVGYCQGEGSEDADGTTAEVCMAKFKNLISLSQPASFMTSPTIKKDNVGWDIYIKDLQTGYDGGVSSGTHTPGNITTVGASFRFLDEYKQSIDWFTSFRDVAKGKIREFLGFSNATLGQSFEGLGEWLENGLVNIENKRDERRANWASKSKLYCQIRFNGEGCEGLSSDRRLKHIFGDNTAGLKEINKLSIKNYIYKADKTKTPQVGVIAQDLQKIFPNSVIEGEDGYLKITQDEMFYALVNSIKELTEQNKKLNKEVPQVNKQIVKVAKENKVLISKNEKLKLQNEKLEAQLKSLEENK